ncbi:MAG: hypothetical protein PVJ73_14395 [Acidobacteriota bacterium]|jgi:hypothetical protein
MKANSDRNWDSDEGRDELRSVLRHWRVPGPPPEIEEDLRRTFRRRRSRRRGLVWVSLAAGVTLLLVSQVERTGRPVPLARPDAGAPVTRAVLPPPTTQEPERPASVAAAPPARAHRRPSPEVAAESEVVVVEPGQAELLAILARRLRGVGEAGRGPIPRAESLSRDGALATTLAGPGTDAPQYVMQWETRTDEWTLVHPSAPFSGR